MSNYYGDFATGTIVYMDFDSFAASTGAPAATSNFAAADIQVYKDGGTTQRSSSAGITVSTSFDSQTGLQMVAIDLSDNTDSGFYAAGHEYNVAVADVTIDGQTMRFWLGAFSIERSGGALALAKNGTYGLSAMKTLIDTLTGYVDTEVAAIKTKTDYLPSATAGSAGGVMIAGSNAATTFATLTVTGSFTVSDGLLVSRSSSNTSAATFTGNGTGSGIVATSGSGATGDGFRAVAASTNGNGLTAAHSGSGADLNATTTPLTLAKTTNITGFNDIAATAIVSSGAITTSGGKVSGVILADTVTTYTGNTPQTGDAYARLGAPAGASHAADVAAVKAVLPVALVSGRIDASVGAMATNTLTAAALATDAVTEIQSGLSTLDAAGVRSALGVSSANLDTQLSAIASYIDTEVGAIYSRIGTPAGASIAADIAGVQSDTDNIQTRLPAALVSGRMDASVGAMAADVITAASMASDAGAEIGTAVWATTTRVLTAGTNIALVKGTGVTGFNDLDAAGIRSALGVASANLDTQIGAINALATTTNGYIDTEIATIVTQTGASAIRSAIGIASANLDTQLGTIAGYLDTEIGALTTNLATANTAIAAVKVTTDANLDAKISTRMPGDGSSTLTEAYPGDGDALTLGSGLHYLTQMLGERSIVGTTVTVKKRDQTTTAMTFTHDDETAPTSITQAS